MAIRRRNLRSTRAKARRIDRIFEYAAYSLISTYALYLLVVWGFSRSLVAIERIEVVGAHAVASSSIVALAKEGLAETFLYRVRRDNALLYPYDELEREVLALSPRIASVRSTAENGGTLKIEVVEYTPNFLYCYRSEGEVATATRDTRVPKECYFADEDGYVYAPAPEYLGYPFVALISSSSAQAVAHPSPIGGSVIGREKYALIRALIDRLSSIGLTARSVTLMEGDDIEVEVGMPWVVRFDVTKDIDRSMENLTVVLSALDRTEGKGADVHEIDLRFGNKIFYR